VIGQYSPSTRLACCSVDRRCGFLRYWRRGVDYKSSEIFLKEQAKSLEFRRNDIEGKGIFSLGFRLLKHAYHDTMIFWKLIVRCTS